MYKAIIGQSAEKKKDFFEKAYLIWFEYCPMHCPLDMDKDEFEWLKKGHKKVCLS